MKAFTAIILATLIVSISISASPVYALGEPSVGVKEGDWIEYNIGVNGTGSAPPTHDVRWMRIAVLQVQDTAFSINLTARYANGTVGSAIWKFNFSEGNVGGWIIIPANLSVGDTFYDSSIHNHKPVNVTIQSEAQKTVLGANRLLTYGNDSFRHKEWDKASGVFVGSSETYRNVTNKDGWYIDNLTVTIEATATNLWSAKVIENQNLTAQYTLLIAGIVLATLVLSSAVLFAKRKKVSILRSPRQRRIVGFALLAALIVTVGAIAVTPLSESQVPLSFREINFIMQTLWLTLLLVSMVFRKKGNYLVHEILMLVVVVVTLVSFSGVLVMSPPTSSSMDEYFSSPADIAAFLAHGVFSIPAIAFGVWLVALWRPGSTSFPAKSKKAAQLTTVFWVISYVVGVVDFMVRTGLIG